MRKKISFSIISAVVVLGLIIYIASCIGCKKNSDVDQEPYGVLIKHSDCKSSIGDKQSGNTAYSLTEDCIQYNYDGIGRLTLKHINAAFNCCPGNIEADLILGSGTITIIEKEQTQSCSCLCLYDLDYQFDNLTPGVYTIRIVEPYIQDTEGILQITIELKNSESGSLCVPRNIYPWN